MQLFQSAIGFVGSQVQIDSFKASSLLYVQRKSRKKSTWNRLGKSSSSSAYPSFYSLKPYSTNQSYFHHDRHLRLEQKQKFQVHLQTKKRQPEHKSSILTDNFQSFGSFKLDEHIMLDNMSLPNDLNGPSSFKRTSSEETAAAEEKIINTLNCTDANHNDELSSWWSSPSEEAPSAPSPGLVLFNSEEQSDLIFIVTTDSDEDNLKFPGHSFIIKDSSPIFKDIVHQIDQRHHISSDKKPIINIQCRPETLHNLMSYIYKKEVILNSVTSCLALLELSIKFMLTELTSICLTFLYENATEFNVLLILSSLAKIDFKPFQTTRKSSTNSKSMTTNTTMPLMKPSNCLSPPTNEGNPGDNNIDDGDTNNNRINELDSSTGGWSKVGRSASITSVIYLSSEGQPPQLVQQQIHQHNPHLHGSNEKIQNLVNELISRCYCILDEFADTILSSEAICNLDRDLLVKILSRDTLKLSSELVAFEAIERWSICQCQRQLTEISGSNRIEVLGDAIYSVRYLTMPLMVFMRGPFASEILTEMDKNYLQTKILDPDTRLPSHLAGRRIDVKRKWIKPNQKSSSTRQCFTTSSLTRKTTSPSSSSSSASSSNSSSSFEPGFERKKKPAIKKFLNGLGDVMIFAIRIFD